ncbi:MAG: DUF5703 domain-containing protein [Cyclobacteriaceae bacterium]|jgi:hypothetical protein
MKHIKLNTEKISPFNWVATLSLIIIMLTGSCISSDIKEGSWVSQYNVTWNSQSENSSGSMPVVGGNIGCNVWVENNELLFYFSSPGAREENGALMKFGRVRVSFEPDIFENSSFEQTLKLEDGAVYIRTKSDNIGQSRIKLWAEIKNPIIHIDIESDTDIIVNASYENWRTEKMLLPLDTGLCQQRYISWSNLPGYPDKAYIYPDEIEAGNETIIFYHRMRENENFFPKLLEQQKLMAIKEQLWDPVTNLTFGGTLVGDNLKYVNKIKGHYAQTDFTGWLYQIKEPAKVFKLKLLTHINQTETLEEWKNQLSELVKTQPNDEDLWHQNELWWDQFWKRSYIIINEDNGPGDIGWQVARNYNIFRYMLVSGFFGIEPSMFNGGTLTFDPLYENRQKEIFKSDNEWVTSFYTPDYRRWGAGLTAQNQRLLYWPMLKSGDFDGILPEFEFYMNTMATTKGKVKYYWGHEGIMCVEQPNITGLLGMAEYGWTDDRVSGFRHRPDDYEVGVSNNNFIGRLYESQLEHAFMMLQYRKYSGEDISEYIPFIEQSVIFYDEHYRMREKERTGNELDDNGKLVIYPSNTLENHPYAKNPTAVMAGLKAVLNGLLELPDSLQNPQKQKHWKSILTILPDYPMGDTLGHQYFKPAENWARNHGAHNPEMYGLYPYELYGLGMPDLKIQENTFLYTTAEDYRTSSGGWSQSVIHAARLGMRDRAANLINDKIGDGPFRFPAFFPGGDYAPDHNVGGSGMIGLQEMVLQTHDNKLHILPAIPKNWDVKFKLYAPDKRVVEINYKNNKFEEVKIIPEVSNEKIIYY